MNLPRGIAIPPRIPQPAENPSFLAVLANRLPRTEPHAGSELCVGNPAAFGVAEFIIGGQRAKPHALKSLVHRCIRCAVGTGCDRFHPGCRYPANARCRPSISSFFICSMA